MPLLVFAKQAVVDQDAGELRTDGLVQQRGDNARIDATTESADHAAITDPAAHLLDRGFGKVAEVPGRLATADADHKVLEQLAPQWRVRHFRMELNPKDGQASMADRGKRTGAGLGQRFKLVTDRGNLVTVAHPDVDLGGQAFEQFVRLADLAGRRPIFATGRVVDFPTERLAGQLHAVANAQHRDAQLKDFGVASGRPGFVNAGRASRQDDAFGSEFSQSLGRNVVPQNLAVNVLFADAPGDQLRVLGTEVQHDDSLLSQLLRRDCVRGGSQRDLGMVWVVHAIGTASEVSRERITKCRK